MHSPGYVDEYVCEVDTDGRAGPSGAFWWVLQDANYNVVALVSDGDGSLSRGEVARQYSWSPYGELLRADIYDTSAPMSRLGHQGLFHDRLDAGILSEPMVAFSRQAVQNKNRTLLSWLARFAQRDPNASGLGVLASLAYHGEAITTADLGINGPELFGDGMNLHGYLRSSPLSGVDPSGLEGFFATIVTNLLTRPIIGNVALTGGRVALSLADDFVMGISGTSLSGGLIGGGTMIGAGLLDDLLQPVGVTLRKIYYGSERTGFGATSEAARQALNEVASGAVRGRLLTRMPPLTDPQLQIVAPGQWLKGQAERVMGGSAGKLIIHFSEHVQSGLRWDVKIKDIVLN